MYTCGIGYKEQYKAYYSCHFIFSSELDMSVIDIVRVWLSGQHPLKRFRSGDFDVDDKECTELSKEMKYEKLQALLDEDYPI